MDSIKWRTTTVVNNNPPISLSLSLTLSVVIFVAFSFFGRWFVFFFSRPTDEKRDDVTGMLLNCCRRQSAARTRNYSFVLCKVIGIIEYSLLADGAHSKLCCRRRREILAYTVRTLWCCLDRVVVISFYLAILMTFNCRREKLNDLTHWLFVK